MSERTKFPHLNWNNAEVLKQKDRCQESETWDCNFFINSLNWLRGKERKVFFRALITFFSFILKYIFLKGYSQVYFFETRSYSFLKTHNKIYLGSFWGLILRPDFSKCLDLINLNIWFRYLVHFVIPCSFLRWKNSIYWRWRKNCQTPDKF